MGIQLLRDVIICYMGYKGICGPKEYGFSAVLVTNRVLVLANFGYIFVINRVWFLHSSLDMEALLLALIYTQTPTQFFWEYSSPGHQ